jgi:ferredoxin-NADP reductase
LGSSRQGSTLKPRRAFPGAGLLDALTGPHGVDGYLEQLNPTWTLSECRAEIAEAARTTPDSVTLKLRPNRSWQGFLPGQFVQVGVVIDGSRRTRCYSPASTAAERGALELTVKSHPGGVVSNHLIENARPGMCVSLSQAGGDFHLPDRRPDRLLLISAGSGITPTMSMLRTLCAEGHRGPIAFLHYAPDAEHALYRTELERIVLEHPNVHLVRSYTRDPGAGEEDGYFSRAQVARVEPEFERAETFACGPPALLDAVRETWSEGLEKRLHVERFVPLELADPSEETGGAIHFARAGLQLDSTGGPLLEQAENAGIPAENGCRMGICHTCTRRKTAGTVRNLVTGELSSAEEEDIQLCISAAVGDVVIDL